MSATIFRHIAESDREILLNWIELDPWHKGKLTPEFFFSKEHLPMVIGDLNGPGLYIRLDAEAPESVRIHIQFSDDPARSGKTLLRAWPTFKGLVAASGVKRMVFASTAPALIGFCCRCFGFKRVAATDDYELSLQEAL